METDLINNISKAANTSLINYQEDSIEDYRPKLIVNNYKKGSKVLHYLRKELDNCEEFYFSVAFITESGISVIKDKLRELEKKNIRGKILTTNYLNFNSPKALREILEFSNIEVRVYDDGNFHSKGYIFKNHEQYNFIIGSSNLSQEALMKNEEWNLKITSMNEGELLKDTLDQFNAAWNDAKVLTPEWIDQYEMQYRNSKIITPQKMEQLILPTVLTPNKMQKEALSNLTKLRENNKNKALLISATGTGKTYLSAFDVKEFNPDRMLFVIHREQIARDAMDSFKAVFGNTKTMGIYSGSTKNKDCDFIFSTIQTLSKDSTLSQFAPNHFDYIIIDEVHHAGAETYKKILGYFKPKFLLGMTATPERTDGYNIYEQFDYNIAYEIRLQHALENDMLCPFHYFGVSEITVDGEVLDDSATFNQLTSDNRVDHIIENAKFYGNSGDRVKGLIFCSRNEEAAALSDKFNQKGYKTVALSGATPQNEREEMVAKLQQDSRENGLDYIFTVDIFNEGIDIPKINQIIMLRPTESAIIFIQQLGRGLRKNFEKDYVVVIDFIGNYQKNFLIPIALSGNKNLKKDDLRRFVFEGTSIIPGCSSIMFDPIAKERIYNSINATNFSTLKFLKEKYIELKNKIGKIPTIMDFYQYGSVDPQVILDYAKSYPEFLRKVDPDFYKTNLTKTQLNFLRFISGRVSNCKRPHEALAIKALLEEDTITKEELNEQLKALNIINDYDGIESAFSVLSGGFFAKNIWQIYDNKIIATKSKGSIKRTDDFSNSLNPKMLENLNDILDYTLLNWQDNYSEHYENTNLSLYQKYTRVDVCRLLNWDKDESMVIFGDPRKPRKNTYPLFVKYEKDKNTSESIKYEDKFINKETFSWLTVNGIDMDSEEIEMFKNLDHNNIKVQLFVIKNDDEGSAHYYLGNVKPVDYNPVTMKKKGKDVPVVNIKFRMETPVREDIYNYLTN